MALTHRSYAFEQPVPVEHNERLEFLGDAVLGAVVTDLIYRRYPELPEGAMARLRAQVVNTQALSRIASGLGIGAHLRLGKGEEASGGRSKDSLLANAIEAVIGAVYLDQGVEVVRTKLEALFGDELEVALLDKVRFDAKNALQEEVVKVHGDIPTYRLSSVGPDHEKRFTADVSFAGRLMGRGAGRSKKEAEQNAARDALHKLHDQATKEDSGARAS